MARRMRRSTPSYTTKPECPHCGSTITSVIYSPGPARGRKLRHRKCGVCLEKFKTYQQVDPLGSEESKILKRGTGGAVGTLEPDQVRDIRQHLKKRGGKDHQLIADLFGVCRTTVTRINLNVAYKHVS